MSHVHEEGCAECGAGYPLYMHSRCHPKSPTWAVLVEEDVLVIECAECSKKVTQFDIKKENKR